MNSNISIAEFKKLDIHIGTIVEATIPEGSEKLIRLVVDCGEELGKRIIFAGIKKFYTPEELINTQIVVLVNLEPRKFMGEEGQGMLLAAGDEKPVLLTSSLQVINGAKIR